MPKENRVHSFALRAWHWLDALVIIGLITTFFLRDFMVSHVREMVSQIGASGLPVSIDSTRPAVRAMVQRLWVWHVYLGYALGVLLVWRLVVLFKDSRNPFLECWREI